jgi:hypothetical protein
MWHVDPLLDNDRETSNYTTATVKEVFRKQECFHDNERTAIREETFSTPSMPMCYNWDHLAVAVRPPRGGGFKYLHRSHASRWRRR